MTEHNNGWEFAKRLSDTLLKIRPLGGSEMFVKRNNQYYADPSYCGGLIEEQSASNLKWIRRAIIAEKENEALVKALEEIIDADTVISDGGKVHDHGPCAQIAMGALAHVGPAEKL